MDMERINENTIRVLIGNEDLAARGITFLDLLGNHKQIESFFYSILEEVDVEEQFQETDAITFQVLPNRDGLELFISKNISMGDSMEFGDFSEGNTPEGFSEFMKNQVLRTQEKKEEVEEDDGSDDTTIEVIIQLEDFEGMIQLAKDVYLQNALSNLYVMNHQYYLHLIFFMEDSSEEQVENEIAHLLEYGRETGISSDVLGEYGTLVMERSALELTRNYFK